MAGLFPDWVINQIQEKLPWTKAIFDDPHGHGEKADASITPPRTHDWSKRPYGTITTRDAGQTVAVVCWLGHGQMPARGDYLILRTGQSTSRYQVDKVERSLSEGDVCTVRATFAPRTYEEKGETP